MSKETNSISTLQDPGIPVRAKLAAAWTSFMFLYIYVDYLHLYKPGAVNDILAGVVFKFTSAKPSSSLRSCSWGSRSS